MFRSLLKRRRKPSALAGVATLSFDQHIEIHSKSDREALQDDWRAIRKDGEKSVRQVIRELHSA